MPTPPKAMCCSASQAWPITAACRGTRATNWWPARGLMWRLIRRTPPTSSYGSPRRPAGLAHRVLGDERQASGRDLRHPCRRARPYLPAPRERDRAEPQRLRPRHHGEVLDAQWLLEYLRREDEQVAGQLLHHARDPGPVSRRGDSPAAVVGALPPAARLHA